MKTYKTILFVVAIFATALIACKKIPGPQGPAGTNGTNGTNGTDGKDGNANVIGTNTVTFYSGDWTAYGTYFYGSINAPAITQAIVDKGAVMVYEQNGTSWLALPYTFGIVSRAFQFSLNNVEIFYENTDGSQTSNPGTQTYRIVAISASNAKAHHNINWKNYDEVKKALNLSD